MKTALGRVPPPPSFRTHLQAELARRCAANAKYSLRAFARDLNTNHATLSQILRAERSLTPRTITELGTALKLPADVVQRYCTSEPAATPAVRNGAALLTRDAAEVLGEWHHFALLELTHLESFRPDVRWISRVLGISTDVVAAALSRLLRLRLLEMDGPTWVDVSGDAIVHVDDFTRTAIARLFAQVRHLTAASIAKPAHPHRSHGVTTLAADSRKIPAAIAAIERFRGELADILSGDAPDALVHFEMHLFPITPPPQESAHE
jgi:transcriptional regulator with XRE-family HTH domain